MFARALNFAGNRILELAETVKRFAQHEPEYKVLRFARAEGRTRRGRVLLAHRLEGLIFGPGDPRRTHHNQFAEVPVMIDVLTGLGFDVDVVSKRRTAPPPARDYALMIATRRNFDVLSAALPPTCLRVLHIETTHWLYNNHASLGRSLEVLRNRGVAPERDIEIERNAAIENADYALLCGNDFVHGTYAHAGKPVLQIPNPVWFVPAEGPARSDAQVRRRFLWLGGRGLAHKGLGRTLEAFAGAPSLHLSVCGPLDDEPAFRRAYLHELNAANVDAVGWTNISSPAFADLARRTLALVAPSCAEAESGAVLNAMAFGLIPVVSREVGLDVDESFGVLLRDDSPAGIRDAAAELARRPAAELEAMSRRARRVILERYSLDAYRTALAAQIETILKDRERRALRGFVRLAPPDVAPDAAPQATRHAAPEAPVRAREA